MTFRTIAKVAIISLTTLQAATLHLGKETNMPYHATMPLRGVAKGERK